jgi:multidrug efflux pump subunit AcrA (membrane-fusion protein)
MNLPTRNYFLISLFLFALIGAIIPLTGCSSPSASPTTPAGNSQGRPPNAPQAGQAAGEQTPGARPSRAAGDAPASAQPTVTPTTSAPVRVAASQIKATGVITSASQATIGFQSAGRIKEIKVKEGDQVKAGGLIASLDTSALDATVIQAQAALDSANANLAKVKAGPTPEDIMIAKGNLERAKSAMDQAQTAYDRIGGAANPTSGLTSQALTLYQNTSAYNVALGQYNLAVNHPTEAELKAAQSTVAQAQASLESAKLAVNNARIVAPFDGTILAINIKVSESAAVATQAVTIADMSRMQVQVNVDENSIGIVQVGQPATISVDALLGKTFMGRIVKIGMIAATSNNIVTIPVYVEIDGATVGLYPGLSATVTFTARQ